VKTNRSRNHEKESSGAGARVTKIKNSGAGAVSFQRRLRRNNLHCSGAHKQSRAKC